MTSEQPAKPPQQQMIWPQWRAAPSLPAIPPGYTLRTYQDGDTEPYVRLMRSAGFESWDESKAERVFATMLPQGLFFVVHDRTQALVATAAAQGTPRLYHPNGLELGWVAADPAERGKGLGYAVCAAVTCRLLDAHPATMYLLTDDSRLPAIAVYLKLGWIPFLYALDFAARWRAVCARLGIEYEDIEMTTDPAGRRP